MALSQKPSEIISLVEQYMDIDRSFIRACSTEREARVNCLVHESWLQDVIVGATRNIDQSKYVYPASEYERQLVLQPSHPGPNLPWIRVCIKVVKKPNTAGSHNLTPSSAFHRLENNAKSTVDMTVAELIQAISLESYRHSWNTALDSYTLAMSYLPKTTGVQACEKDSMRNIIKDVFGIPVFQLKRDQISTDGPTIGDETHDEHWVSNGTSNAEAPKNSNIIPVLCALESDEAFFLIEPFFPLGLHDISTFSPAVMSHSTVRLLFVVYQLLHALRWYHEHDLPFGKLTLENVRVGKGLFLYLTTPSFREILEVSNHTISELTTSSNAVFSDAQPVSKQNDARCDINTAGEGVVAFKNNSLPRDDATIVQHSVDLEDAHASNGPPRPEHDLSTLVDMWVRNEISNFDYLMALNYFSGRRMGDPNYHPLFPWVTDFSDQHSGFRDLSKSKFRLNKGDHQLDMTYKQAWFESHEGGSASTVPHHVSDVLSDITFHAYLARRTPVSVLCAHLRSNWVPNEYPSTMQRLYAWTPDECIPQFFSDSTIFTSIHPDLPDLAVPPWTPSPEDFINWHRQVLESDNISRDLHHWIDLTFGYKLSGKSAIKAKNVCLDLVDKHQSVSNHGVVQLFTQPHPPQSECTTLLNSTPLRHPPLCWKNDCTSFIPEQVALPNQHKPHLEGSMMSLESIDDGSQDTDLLRTKLASDRGSTDHTHNNTNPLVNTLNSLIGPKESILDDDTKVPMAEVIHLPEDSKPLDLLNKYEAIQKFRRQFPMKKQIDQMASKPRLLTRDAFLRHLMQKDMESLGCLIVEMVLPEKVRLVSAGLSPEQKTQAIKDLVSATPKLLPRFVRSGVFSLLKQESKLETMNGSSTTSNESGDEEEYGLPPLSAGLLLHPQTGIFPFPLHFQELHYFLVKLNEARIQSSHKDMQELLNTTSSKYLPENFAERFGHCFRYESEYTISQVDVSLQFLPSLLPKLDDEGFQLLLYHLEPLFTSQETCLYAFTNLFDLLAHAMGPKVTAKTFLKPLIQLCDSRSLENYEHIAAQGFLSQIIVRFGLENFLTHFVSFVIDAVAFELMLEKTTQAADRSSVHSSEEAVVDDSESDKERSSKEKQSKTAIFLSVDDDDYMGDASGTFSDQEDTDNYTVHVDDIDEYLGPRKPVFLCQGHTEEFEDYVDDRDGDKKDFLSAYDELAMAMKDTSQDDSTTGTEEEASSKERGEDEKEDYAIGETPERDGVYREEIQQDVTSDKRDEVNSGEDERKTTNENEENVIAFEDFGHRSTVDTGQDDNSGENGIPIENVEEDTKDDELEQGKEDEEDERENSSSGSESDEETSDANEETNGESAYGFYQDTTLSPVHKPEEKEAERASDLTPAYVSGIAAESVMWLAPRLGPVLTSKYLAHQLLQILPQCYVDVLGVEEYEHEDEDRKAKWVLYCLGSFCILYGEAFVLHQYLPYIEKIISTVHTKFSARGEASLGAVFALLKYCIPYMSKDTLVDIFEALLKTFFQPVLRILSSWNIKFPGGGDARAALCHSYVDLLTALSLKLERELARELMTAPLQQFFSCFELIHLKKKEYKMGKSSFTAVSSSVEETDDSQKLSQIESTQVQKDHEGDITRPDQIEAFYKTNMYEELCQTFSAAMAHHAYVPLCGIMGSKYMETALYNHDLIWNLCCSHDAQLSHPTCEEPGELGLRNSDDDSNGEKPGDECELDSGLEEGTGDKNVGKGTEEAVSKKSQKQPAGKGSRRSKPRITAWLTGRKNEKNKEPDTGKPEVSSSSDQYLRGSWLEHWKYQLHSTTRGRGSRFNLQQMKLQTFTGHSGSVRSIYVQDSEHFFLSASKDKTVKLWSLSNHGGGTAQSASSCTYYHHSRGVFAVDMVESIRQAASCDGSVHIWDPVSGSTLGILELPRGNTVVAMTAMPAPSQSVVVATSEATTRFVDVRQCRFVQEWKVTTSNVAGSVRDICCSPDGRWVAVGFSSGLVSVLDVRGGLLRSQRRAHTNDILQVCAFSNNSLLTSSVDQGLALWKDDGVRIGSFKGHLDPLQLLIVLKDHVISASTANRIGLHQTQDELAEAPYTSYKLPPDVFRGNITSMGYLPLNRLLLLGSDTGNITLCA